MIDSPLSWLKRLDGQDVPGRDAKLVDSLIAAGRHLNEVQRLLAPIRHPHNRSTATQLRRVLTSIDAMMFVYDLRPRLDAARALRDSEEVSDGTTGD